MHSIIFAAHILGRANFLEFSLTCNPLLFLIMNWQDLLLWGMLFFFFASYRKDKNEDSYKLLLNYSSHLTNWDTDIDDGKEESDTGAQTKR